VSGSPQTGEGARQMNALVPGLLDERQHHFHLPFLADEASEVLGFCIHTTL